MSTPATPDPATLLALARDVAAEAGQLVVRMRERGVRVAGTKSSDIDVVTEADRASERLIRDRLLAVRPGDAVVGEEGQDRPGSSGVSWIVDPIDGTVNYLYGQSAYAVSIAAAVAGEVVAAVVRNPATGEEYVASRGGGAWCGDRRLAVRPRTALGQSLVATGFNYEQHVRRGQAVAIARMLPLVRDIRRRGSCALDLCGVAAGLLDAYVEEGPMPWDDAAGGLIATEAGAVVEVGTGRSGRRLVVCAPEHSFARFRELVADCGF